MNPAPWVINEQTVIGSRCGPFPPAIEGIARGKVRVAMPAAARGQVHFQVAVSAGCGRDGSLRRGREQRTAQVSVEHDPRRVDDPPQAVLVEPLDPGRDDVVKLREQVQRAKVLAQQIREEDAKRKETARLNLSIPYAFPFPKFTSISICVKISQQVISRCGRCIIFAGSEKEGYLHSIRRMLLNAESTSIV